MAVANQDDGKSEEHQGQLLQWDDAAAHSDDRFTLSEDLAKAAGYSQQHFENISKALSQVEQATQPMSGAVHTHELLMKRVNEIPLASNSSMSVAAQIAKGFEPQRVLFDHADLTKQWARMTAPSEELKIALSAHESLTSQLVGSSPFFSEVALPEASMAAKVFGSQHTSFPEAAITTQLAQIPTLNEELTRTFGPQLLADSWMHRQLDQGEPYRLTSSSLSLAGPLDKRDVKEAFTEALEESESRSEERMARAFEKGMRNAQKKTFLEQVRDAVKNEVVKYLLMFAVFTGGLVLAAFQMLWDTLW